MALSRVAGVEAALEVIADLEGDPALANYYLLPSVKGRLLSDLGDLPGAAACYRTALALSCSEPERRLLLRRLRECDGSTFIA